METITKNAQGKLVIIKQVEELIDIENVNLDIERLKGQIYEVGIKLQEFKDMETSLKNQLQTKIDLVAEIGRKFPEVVETTINEIM